MTFFDRAQNPQNCFDFERFVFATGVIFTHSFALLTGNANSEPLVWLTDGRLTFGFVSLGGFFVLSGYLVVQSWLKSNGFLDYLRKRVLRIYPGFLAVLLVGALVIGPLASAAPQLYFKHLPIRSLLAQSVVLHEPELPDVFRNIPYADIFNGSLWTIKWEFCCYLLVPVLGWIGFLHRRVGTALLFLSVAVAFGIFCYGHVISVERSFAVFGGPAYGWLRCAGYFLAGITFYLWQDKLPYRISWLGMALVGLLVFSRWIDLALMILGPYLLFYAGYAGNAFLQQWSRPGDFSYGLYLYAWPIQQLTVQWLGRYLTPYSFFALSFCETALLAGFSWFVVERPFLRLKCKSRSLAHASGPRLTGV